MIVDYANIEGWRRLLEEEIPREMGHYRDRVAVGQATAAWHTQAAQQCAAWKARIAAMQAHAQMPLFQQRHALWTTTAINGLVASLDAIETAVLGQVADLLTVLTTHVPK